jgi:hypothetical protein
MAEANKAAIEWHLAHRIGLLPVVPNGNKGGGGGGQGGWLSRELAKNGNGSASKKPRSRPKAASGEEAAAVPLRRSNRKRNVEPESRGLTHDGEDERRERAYKKKKNKSIALARRRAAAASASDSNAGKGQSSSSSSLVRSGADAKRLSELSGIPSDRWLDDLRSYLLKVESLSHPNCASVMRQAIKLVSRQGVTYGRWDEGVVFGRGLDVHLGMDFDALHDDAVDFENEHGADLGNGACALCASIRCRRLGPAHEWGKKRTLKNRLRNGGGSPLLTGSVSHPFSLSLFRTCNKGWLLRHPIKKLGNFQQYLLEGSP